ncbi:MAG: PVC-type heme-binding CxxCH protein [Candidatus Hydrogenedentes bacterium]|nr:PVC-type heme-binding CxxCH protein [Candidatus Hydrogenedentota bacterium]
MTIRNFYFVFFACMVAAGQDAPADHSVANVLSSLRLADDSLVIECVASEPDIIDPVAVTWDEDGRMYVVEMRDYPMGPTGGTIRQLTDSDGDGRYENATVFADGLPYPNSALAYNGGLLVTAAPDVWFLKDNDADGIADERRVVLTGFGEGNQQLRINGLFWGLDNWIYAANGRSDGTVRRPEDAPESAILMRHHDLRFKPDFSAIEPISGLSQFGIAQDDWGNRFLSWNTVPIRHIALEERYLTRNPLLAATATEALIAKNDLRIYPIVPPQQRFNTEPIEYWNASCGLTIYRGGSLPGYNGNAFVCESVTSLVHRMALEPDGPTFVARRADAGKEFLASTDLWFRPVNLATGPDGALYIVDFVREWVEHPDFVPQEMRDSVNWRNGDTLGRIWRVRAKDAAVKPAQKLSGIASAGLITFLDHANAWYRTQAQRLLVTRGDDSIAPVLKELAREASTPQGRIHALWTLEGLAALDGKTLIASLKDPDARVRRQAVLLCESRASNATVEAALARLVSDSDAAVRFQVAATAGALPADARLPILTAIAATDAYDPWFRLALLGSTDTDASSLLNEVLAGRAKDIDSFAYSSFDFLAGLSELVGASDKPDDIVALIAKTSSAHSVTAAPSLALLSGLTKGLARTGSPLRARLATPSNGLTAGTVAALQPVFANAEHVANREGARDYLRAAAVVVIGQQPGDEAIAKLKTMMTSSRSDVVRNAALNALVNGGDSMVTASLLQDWSALSVPARRLLVSSMLASPVMAEILVEAMEQGRPAPQELDASARETLKAYPVAALQERAAMLFVIKTSPDKEELIAQYKPVLDLAGDKSRGAGIFAMNCMPCHTVQGIGQKVGPDLSAIATKTKEQLLHDILDPNAEVSPDFINYTISTLDLDLINGVIGAETATSVTVKQAAGIEVTVMRDNIEEMSASTMSLMPQGLEQAFDVQGMADLLEFLHHSDRRTLEAAAATATVAAMAP